jgi:acetyl-CoA carboxylase carboxyl transferase subunit beta
VWVASLKVCSHCGHHDRIGPGDRLRFHFDPDTFKSLNTQIETADPLAWVDGEIGYRDMLRTAQSRTDDDESIRIGVADIEGIAVGVGLFDFRFMGGTLGSVTGERIASLLEYCDRESLPAVFFTSSGGARMQEGMNSLLQMAKIAAALRRLKDRGGFAMTVLCDPTTGGVAASIGFAGDVVLAEPGALVGFTGPRVVVEAVGQELPPGFQQSENRLGQGLVDAVVPRSELRAKIYGYLSSIGSR